MCVVQSKIQSSLHDPTTLQLMILDLKRDERKEAYPRGPPPRTSLSRSRPDISTAAPPPTLPNTFSTPISTVLSISQQQWTHPRVFRHYRRITRPWVILASVFVRRRPHRDGYSGSRDVHQICPDAPQLRTLLIYVLPRTPSDLLTVGRPFPFWRRLGTSKIGVHS